MSDPTIVKKKRSPINALKMINELRQSRGLPKVARKPSKIAKTAVTKLDILRICKEVWLEQYPKSVTDKDFILGELTAKLVEQEVARRIQILRGQLTPYRKVL